jgi:hypothetical protein
MIRWTVCCCIQHLTWTISVCPWTGQAGGGVRPSQQGGQVQDSAVAGDGRRGPGRAGTAAGGASGGWGPGVAAQMTIWALLLFSVDAVLQEAGMPMDASPGAGVPAGQKVCR